MNRNTPRGGAGVVAAGAAAPERADATEAGRPFGLNLPLLVFVATIPLQNVYLGKIPHMGAGINYLNVMVVLSYLGMRYGKNLGAGARSRIGRPLALFMGVYALSLVLGIFTLGEVGENHVNTLKDILIGFSFYFLVLGTVRDKAGMVRVLACTLVPLPLMFYSFHNQFMSVVQFHFGHGAMHYDDDALRRVNGTFMDLGSNEYAAFFAGYPLMLLALFLGVKHKLVRGVLGGLIALNAYCLLFSYSRGAWVSFLLGLGVLLFFYSRKVFMVAVLTAVISSGAIYTMLPVSVQERFSTIFVSEENRDESAEERLIVWSIAKEAFMKDPLFGVGFHVFHHLNPFGGKDTHNYFVKVLTEQGIVGFLVLFTVFWRIFWVSVGAYIADADPLYRAVGMGMIAVLAAFMLGNLFGDRLSHYPLGAYFWVYAALSQRALLLSEARQQEEAEAAAAPGPVARAGVRTIGRPGVRPGGA